MGLYSRIIARLHSQQPCAVSILNDRTVSRNPNPLPSGLGPVPSSDAAIAEENRLVEALRDAAQGGGR
jgi:hypothetical protein